MVVSPKNSLLNVALRMLVASPLALSAPTGTSATEPLLALERIDQPSDLQPVGASDLYPPGAGAFGKRIKARKGVNIESYQWQKAFPDPHSDHYNNDWDKMESQRREISKKIKELTKHYVNVKNMGTIHEVGESSDEVVAQLHQTILKVTWIHDWLLNEYRRNVLKSSSSPFALTLATVTHQPGKEWVWETEDLFDGIWKELSQVQRETPNETSDPHLLAFHSTLSKIVPLLGNFMTVHKLKSPEFIENNFVLTLRPEDLVNLIDSFARSRHEILDDLKLYLASKDDLLRSFMIKPEKHASSIIDLNFMMSSESLKLFREGIKVLNNEDKQLAVLACEQGMLSQMKQASDALRKLRERSRFVGSNHTANRAKRHDLRG